MIKESRQILDAIESLPGRKFLVVGILPADIRTYTVECEGLVTGNRLPLLFAIASAMDSGGHIIIQHQLNLKHFVDGKLEFIYQWYGIFLGERRYEVMTEADFRQFFNRQGVYKKIRISK